MWERPIVVNGPQHPLIKAAHHRSYERNLPLARKVREAHWKNAVSDQSIVRIDGSDSAVWIGPAEQYGHLLGHDSDHIAVTLRDSTSDLARRLSGVDNARATTLLAAAYSAAPMVAAVLAIMIRAELVEWDTGESVAETGRRIAMDAGYRLLAEIDPATELIKPRNVFVTALDLANIVQAPAEEYAKAYLAGRDAINAALAEQDIDWGGPLVDASTAADRAKVSWSTWRAYMSRGQAPAPDRQDPPRFRPATIDAWLLTRPNTPATWW